MRITLIGLGVGSDGVSIKALDVLRASSCIICKTALTQSANIFEKYSINVTYLDDMFSKSRNFDTLNHKLAAYVIQKSKIEPVVYCVDGSVTDDNSCAEILKKCKDVQVIDGVSHSLSVLSKLTGRGGYTALSAYNADDFSLSVVRPFVLYDIDNQFVAADWKLRLTDAFGDTAPAVLYIDGKAENIPLYMLDTFEKYDYTTVLVVFKQDFLHKERFCVDDLFKIIYALRAENGCPWDKVQTRDSISKNLLEECYELYDAIKRDDSTDMIEESGDVLLQLVFQTVFGEEKHEYLRNDVISGICSKLIFRHSHVFGTDKAKNGDEALDVWEKNKSIEKGYSSGSEYLSLVPSSFPALMRAQKLQKRAAKYNFDFSQIDQIYGKINEECDEIKNAASCGGDIAEEIGDLLFTAVNLARFYHVDAEEALYKSNEKFFKRFCALESAVKKDGKDLKNMTEEEIDKYYNEIKKS